MNTPLLPVGYQSLVGHVMDSSREYHAHPEYRAHPEWKNQKTEFNEIRGIFISVDGWRIFWDQIGECQPHIILNRGYLYDAENGLGYIGVMVWGVEGKPTPVLDYWAMRTRLESPGIGRYVLDKTNAIYEYESTQLS
jgi:hypothetical protein